MKVLVLGGSGFIGSALIDGLLNQGHQVKVFDRNIETLRKQFPEIADAV
ncbi:NAD-dependent epimerase/dehydratase family protein, partial [Methylophaga sp. UBA3191]